MLVAGSFGHDYCIESVSQTDASPVWAVVLGGLSNYLVGGRTTLNELFFMLRERLKR